MRVAGETDDDLESAARSKKMIHRWKLETAAPTKRIVTTWRPTYTGLKQAAVEASRSPRKKTAKAQKMATPGDARIRRPKNKTNRSMTQQARNTIQSRQQPRGGIEFFFSIPVI